MKRIAPQLWRVIYSANHNSANNSSLTSTFNGINRYVIEKLEMDPEEGLRLLAQNYHVTPKLDEQRVPVIFKMFHEKENPFKDVSVADPLDSLVLGKLDRLGKSERKL